MPLRDRSLHDDRGVDLLQLGDAGGLSGLLTRGGADAVSDCSEDRNDRDDDDDFDEAESTLAVQAAYRASANIASPTIEPTVMMGHTDVMTSVWCHRLPCSPSISRRARFSKYFLSDP